MAVFASEHAAQVAIARRWPGPEDYVTVVASGRFTWAVWIEHDDRPAGPQP